MFMIMHLGKEEQNSKEVSLLLLEHLLVQLLDCCFKDNIQSMLIPVAQLLDCLTGMTDSIEALTKSLLSKGLLYKLVNDRNIVI